MIKQLSISLLLTGSMGLFFCGCQDNRIDDLVAVNAEFIAQPTEGLTTTIFSFDASETFKNVDSENPVVIRYDWNGDGIWDEPFGTQKNQNHRFYAPGTYSVAMEALDINGQRDTAMIEVSIEQGYSAPRAFFICKPDSANILKEFVFDASLSEDDEDSLWTLEFRWDFNGDQIWDTPLDTIPLTTHQYVNPGHYQARIQVVDPSGLSEEYERLVIANLYDSQIKAVYTIESSHFTVEDTILTDASMSSHALGLDITGYSWDFGNDGVWEVENNPDPRAWYVFPVEGLHQIKLRVHDERGLYMDTIQTVEIFPYNSPPEPRFKISSHVGNPGSQFLFDGRNSFDRDESLMDIHFQWDTDGDGVFEPEWNDEWMPTSEYADTGTYVITLRVMDNGGKYTDVQDSIRIFTGTRETSYIYDKRMGGNYYGAVKIGTQWWMQENLRYYNSELDPPINKHAYANNQEYYNLYGGLYYPRYLFHRVNICPDGWHVPLKEDFNTLFEYLGEEQLSQKLIYGGSSELHIQVAGWTDFASVSKGMGTMTHLWTSDRYVIKTLYQALFINTMPGEARFVWTNASALYYVRCIKD